MKSQNFVGKNSDLVMRNSEVRMFKIINKIRTLKTEMYLGKQN